MEQFKIKTEVFEGPLDLLLSLIEKRKLHISDISLAKVADDYIAHVNELGSFPIAQSAHFILIASTLVLIKSKSLLPGLSLSEEEQGSIEDLERRLREYKRFRELSRQIKEQFGRNVMYSRFPAKQIQPVFSPTKEISFANIYSTIIELLRSVPMLEKVPQAIIKKVISLEEVIENLTERIKKSLKMTFRDFAGSFAGEKEKKVAVIVSFLAMLELVKQGIVSVRQESSFDEIEIESDGVNIPSYGQ